MYFFLPFVNAGGIEKLIYAFIHTIAFGYFGYRLIETKCQGQNRKISFITDNWRSLIFYNKMTINYKIKLTV